MPFSVLAFRNEVCVRKARVGVPEAVWALVLTRASSSSNFLACWCWSKLQYGCV